MNFDLPVQSSKYFTEGEFCCHLLFLFTQSQSVYLLLIYWSFTAVAGWQHMRKMSDPRTVPPLWVSVGNRETQYYFSHQQRDALNIRGSGGLWGGVGGFCGCHVHFTPQQQWQLRNIQLRNIRELPCTSSCVIEKNLHGANDITCNCKTNIPSLTLNWRNFISKRGELPFTLTWRFWRVAVSLNTPHCLTPAHSLYFVQPWSWVTGPLCNAGDPKPVYCLKSLPLSATPTSTSLQRHTATLLSVASSRWQITLSS